MIAFPIKVDSLRVRMVVGHTITDPFFLLPTIPKYGFYWNTLDTNPTYRTEIQKATKKGK